MAPGWIIAPALAVLAYSFLVLKQDRPYAGVVEVAWEMTWSVAGLAALGAVAWWAGTVFGIA